MVESGGHRVCQGFDGTFGIDRVQRDRPPPDSMYIFQDLERTVEIQTAPIRFVLVVQLQTTVGTDFNGQHGRRSEIVFRRQYGIA